MRTTIVTGFLAALMGGAATAPAVPDDSPALKGLTLKGGKFVTLLGS